MSRLPAIFLAAVLLATGLALAALYRLRMGQGDIFPAYSTLRADPLGLRALHDSLADLPGMKVTRWLRPVADLPPAPARTLVLAGFMPWQWEHLTADQFNALDAAVRGGCRLVIALHAPTVVEIDGSQPRFQPAPQPEPSKPQVKKGPLRPGPRLRLPTDERRDADAVRSPWVNLAKLWGVELRHRPFRGAVHRDATASPGLPQELPWNSDVYFVPAQGVDWTVLYRGPDPMLLERREGLGSIVLAGDADFLANEALQRNRAVSLLVAVVGRERRVEFIESHLGVMEHPGLGRLARRYGLAPAFCALLVFAGLFVWRRMAGFVPPPVESDALLLNYQQTAGLEALLRRSVAPAELLPACVAEWRATARAGDQARVDAALAGPAVRAAPAAAYNAVVRALRRPR